MTYINRIRIRRTCCNISNFLITCIDTGFCDARTILNCQATIVHHGITSCYGFKCRCINYRYFIVYTTDCICPFNYANIVTFRYRRVFTCPTSYSLQLIFCCRLTTSYVSRIPCLISQVIHCTACAINSYFTCLNCSFRTLNRNLLIRICSKSDVIIEVYFISLRSIIIGCGGYRCIFTIL